MQADQRVGALRNPVVDSARRAGVEDAALRIDRAAHAQLVPLVRQPVVGGHLQQVTRKGAGKRLAGQRTLRVLRLRIRVAQADIPGRCDGAVDLEVHATVAHLLGGAEAGKDARRAQVHVVDPVGPALLVRLKQRQRCVHPAVHELALQADLVVLPRHRGQHTAVDANVFLRLEDFGIADVR
ncbi:hypothetical protein G6F35_014445 [Rhizopus arrhizus]|nr:hypothetical protein G6F35_014445 [Rhizopus arrhizus]